MVAPVYLGLEGVPAGGEHALAGAVAGSTKGVKVGAFHCGGQVARMALEKHVQLGVGDGSHGVS
jgi:hypothetical protein